MSRTLFWYILKDLLRVFLLTAAGLAAIMSFGGLLRPLTEHGLNALQAAAMLGCFVPAMTAYSFPIAALFATSIVYGRLSADNELTACRSTGIAYLSLTMPALVLGLLVALLSLLCLCFVVPLFTLKVEQIIYSNMPQFVQNEIEKTHQIQLNDLCVTALSAHVMEHSKNQVELDNPMVVTYMIPPQDTPAGKRYRAPKEFFTARKGVARIEQNSDEVDLYVDFIDGSKFPRELTDAPRATVRTERFGPIVYPSPIKEDPKFMVIQTLKYIYDNPQNSRRLSDEVGQLVKQEQQRIYLTRIRDQLNESGGTITFRNDAYLRNYIYAGLSGPKHSFTLTSNSAAGPSDAQNITISSAGAGFTFAAEGGELILRSKGNGRTIRVDAHYPDGDTATRELEELHIRVEPVAPNPRSRIAVTLAGYAAARNTADADPSFRALMTVLTPTAMLAPDPTTGEDFSDVTLTLTRGSVEAFYSRRGRQDILPSDPDNTARQIKLVLRRNGAVQTTWQSREMVIKVDPQILPRDAVDQTPQLALSIEGYDVLVNAPEENGPDQPSNTTDSSGDMDAEPDLGMAQHKTFRTDLDVPMPSAIQEMQKMTISDFKNDPALQEDPRLDHLMQTNARWKAKLLGEINSRAAFSVSCLVLVMVGCSLGMMFRSGNFLSAFAVSFIPAMISIALIVTGQQICSRVNNGGNMGLMFLWSGNCIVTVLGVYLLGRLQRQ